MSRRGRIYAAFAGLAVLAATSDVRAADAGGACPTTDPVDPASLPYVSPEEPRPGACSAKDIAAIERALPTAGSDAEVKKLISAACAACVFTDATSAKWGPVPETNDVPLTFDVGGCYERETGDEACGKAYQNLVDCGHVACTGCPGGDNAAYESCLKAANTGACAVEVTSYQTACMAVMDKYAAAQDVCEPPSAMYDFEGAITVFCGGAGDGGTPDTGAPDAGPDDAGAGPDGKDLSASPGCSSAGSADLSPVVVALALALGGVAIVFSRRRSAEPRSSRSASRTSRSKTRRT